MPSPPPRRVRQPGHQRSGGRTRLRAWRSPPPFPKTLPESCRQARKGPGGARWGKSHRPSPLEARGFAKGNNLCEKKRRRAPIYPLSDPFRSVARPASAACVGGREGGQSWGGVGGAGPSDKKRTTTARIHAFRIPAARSSAPDTLPTPLRSLSLGSLAAALPLL